MKRVLVIGGHGSIGSRYCAILRYMGIDYDIEEINRPSVINNQYPPTPITDRWSHVIIATPTNTHTAFLYMFQNHDVDILCEKPISLNPDDLLCFKTTKARIRMVNNWTYLPFIRYQPHSNTIIYDYYSSGKESLVENMAQPLYLGNNDSEFYFNSPIFKCEINGHKVNTEHFQESYVEMLQCWFSGVGLYWNIDDSIDMAKYLQSRE